MSYCTKCGKPTDNEIMCEECIILDSPWLCAMKSKELDLTEQIKNLKAENDELRARLDNAGEFPCKVGDIIYQIDTNGTRIFKSTVKNIIFETDGVAFDERAIGESIFLTEEAVKEKMKKLQEKRQ